jgi:hypothetical protein
MPWLATRSILLMRTRLAMRLAVRRELLLKRSRRVDQKILESLWNEI